MASRVSPDYCPLIECAQKEVLLGQNKVNLHSFKLYEDCAAILGGDHEDDQIKVYPILYYTDHSFNSINSDLGS